MVINSLELWKSERSIIRFCPSRKNREDNIHTEAFPVLFQAPLRFQRAELNGIEANERRTNTIPGIHMYVHRVEYLLYINYASPGHVHCGAQHLSFLSPKLYLRGFTLNDIGPSSLSFARGDRGHHFGMSHEHHFVQTIWTNQSDDQKARFHLRQAVG